MQDDAAPAALAGSLGGTLTNIAGSVKVSNSSGTTALTLDDSGDTTVRTATITSAAVTGTWSPGAIDYTGNEVSSLTLDGGKAGNPFNVQNTGTTTNLVLAGATAVKVGNAGSAQGIVGSLREREPEAVDTQPKRAGSLATRSPPAGGDHGRPTPDHRGWALKPPPGGGDGSP
jgi:hypothetical protein